MKRDWKKERDKQELILFGLLSSHDLMLSY